MNLKLISAPWVLCVLLRPAVLNAQAAPAPAPNPPPSPPPSPNYPYPSQYPYYQPQYPQYPPPYPYPAYNYPAGYEPAPKPRYPSDSAARTWPFVDLLAGGVSLEQRFSDYLAFGLSAGVYLADLVRIAPQISAFLSGPDDKGSADLAPGFFETGAESPNILWGGSAGVALISRQTFTLSPGVLFLRTDKSEYGSFLGINFPFDWVMDGGTRMGFSISIGRSFGGSIRAECGTGAFAVTQCDPGEIRDFDRPAGAGFYSDFHIGWGAGHPDPLPAAR